MKTYQILLTDSFDQSTQVETIVAEEIDDAIEQAFESAEDFGLNLSYLTDEVGATINLILESAQRFSIHNCSILLQSTEDGTVIEDEIPSLSLSMALDLIALAWPGHCVLAVETETSRYHVNVTVNHDVLPLRWRWLGESRKV